MSAGFKGLFQEPHSMLGKVEFLEVVGVYSAWKASKLHLTSLESHLKVTFHLKTQCSHGKPQAWKEERFRSIQKTEGSSRASPQKWFLRFQRSLNQFVPSLPWENCFGSGHSLREESLEYLLWWNEKFKESSKNFQQEAESKSWFLLFVWKSNCFCHPFFLS